MKRRIISLALCAVLGVSLLSGCGKSGSDTVKIGLTVPLSGDRATEGSYATNAMKLVVDEINSAGGVLGKQLEVVVQDTTGTDVGATNAYLKLAADKNITVFNQKLRRRAQIRSEITPRPNGTYTVSLAFCDEQDSPLLKMELMVPKEVMAKDLADRFRKNTEQLYASVINALFEAPREKKE